MKKSLIIFLFLLSLVSYAKKFVYPIEVVAGMADLIVVGEIERVHSDFYNFKIKNTIKGEEQETINVHIFKEWKCDTHMKKTAVGQKLFLFLNKKINSYEIINGSTGELFIEDNRILRTIFEMKPTVDELTDAVRTFTSYYVFKGVYSPLDKNVFIQKNDDYAIRMLLVQASPLTIRFFDKMKLYTIEHQL